MSLGPFSGGGGGGRKKGWTKRAVLLVIPLDDHRVEGISEAAAHHSVSAKKIKTLENKNSLFFLGGGQ